jgi:hypothetical protein
MKVAVLAVLTLLLAVPQEKHELAWKFREGMQLDVAWKVSMRTAITEGAREAPKNDYVMEFAGRLRILSVREGRAEGELRITRLGMRGLQSGRMIDVLVDKGAVIRGGEGGKRLLDSLARPGKVELTPRGQYSIKGDGFLNAFFAGGSDFFGPTLPDGPVAVGDSWKTDLVGNVPLTVTYRLASLEKERATVLLDQESPYEPPGLKARYRIKTKATFEVAGGFCSRSETVITLRGTGDEAKGQRVEADTSIEFESAPAR